jgi:predicted Fe-S protein YdhL (DUF1289 family)
MKQKIDDRTERPLSPCILICTLDDDKRCLGCGRTLAQISEWALMSVEQQWQVIAELDVQRRANDATIAPEVGE